MLSPFWLTGIQKNVQALYYILNHPLVYRDAKPRLDSLQKSYVPRKKVKGADAEGRTAALMLLVPLKQRCSSGMLESCSSVA